MAQTKAISLLEQIDDQAIDRPSRDVTPGITIRVLQIASQPVPIDITPRPPIIDAGES